MNLSGVRASLEQGQHMSSAEDLVQAFVSVWNERNPSRRSEMVRTLWAPDGRHLMGAQDVRGHDALEERVATSNQRNIVEKDYTFRPATAIQSLPGVIKFRWDMARSKSDELISAGVGFLTVNDEGRIVCDYLFTEL
jgi:SnoaL-like domain